MFYFHWANIQANRYIRGQLRFSKSDWWVTSWQDMFQDALTNQLLTFPPRQKMLWREAGVGPLWAWVTSSHLSCLTWLFFLSRITVPSSISNSPWSFKHLTYRMRWHHPVIIGKKSDCCQVCESTCTNLNIETLWRLHVLRDVQAVTSTHRAHEVRQRLFILVEPLQLAKTQNHHLNISLSLKYTEIIRIWYTIRERL